MRVPIVLAFVMCGGAALSAQLPREREDVHLRNDCRLASQVLTTGEPRPHRQWALAYINRCDETGPGVLAAAWEQVPTGNRDAVGSLVYATRRLRDRRLLDVMLRAAGDPTRPALLRLASLQVLIAYFDTSAYVELSTLESPPSLTVISDQIDFVAMDGSEPLPITAPETILNALRVLAEQDPDPVVQRAAQFIARGLDARRKARQGIQ